MVVTGALCVKSRWRILPSDPCIKKMSADISRRQHLIMDYIREHGSVQVDQLSNHLQVTPQTIRRDLNQLYETTIITACPWWCGGQGQCRKTWVTGRAKFSWLKRSRILRKRVAELLPDNSSLFHQHRHHYRARGGVSLPSQGDAGDYQ